MANKRFMTMRTSLPSTPAALKKLGVDEGGKVQQFATDEIYRRLPAYMPKKTGNLRGTAFVKKSTRIRVWAKYARAQFFGVTKDGKPFNYDRSSAPKAGPHWDRRLVASEGARIAKAVNKYVKGKV